MRRKLLNGVLGGAATVGVLYLFGVIGLLAERFAGLGAISTDLALLGLLVAVVVGLLVLQRVSTRSQRVDDDSKSETRRSG
jgi:hypothetical protein